MGRGAPLFTRIERVVLLALAFVVVPGCATSARDLPPIVTSPGDGNRVSLEDFDAATASLSCWEIEQELQSLSDAVVEHEQAIYQKRQQNQVAGYIGLVFFLPALAATDNSEEEKRKLDDIYAAKDKLFTLQSIRKCPAI